MELCQLEARRNMIGKAEASIEPYKLDPAAVAKLKARMAEADANAAASLAEA